jgi:hypothetical protein
MFSIYYYKHAKNKQILQVSYLLTFLKKFNTQQIRY